MSPLTSYDKNGRRFEPRPGPSGRLLALLALLIVVATAATEGATGPQIHAFIMRALLVAAVGVAIVAIVVLWLVVLVACWRAIDEDTGEQP